MKKFILNENDHRKLGTLYENRIIKLLLEINIGKIAKEVRSAGFLRDVETAKNALRSMKEFVSYMDDIIIKAKKIKNSIELDDIVAKLLHIYNPGSLADKVGESKTQVINLLNAYSQNKGFQNFARLKDDVVKSESSAKAASGQGQGFSQGTQQSSSYAKSSENVLKDLFKSGQYINSEILKKYSNYIDFSQMTYLKNIDELNKAIARAIINPENLIYISRKGFEKFGIDDFRKFLRERQDLSATIKGIFPGTGTWNFKIN